MKGNMHAINARKSYRKGKGIEEGGQRDVSTVQRVCGEKEEIKARK
jgi:hypothetical protein